ncbi:hypothetical protein B566_EDAN008797 [Ephemera danica]|nr:hypothetical protein B566_EDAN008797 [Ephemera danica]
MRVRGRTLRLPAAVGRAATTNMLPSLALFLLLLACAASVGGTERAERSAEQDERLLFWSNNHYNRPPSGPYKPPPQDSKMSINGKGCRRACRVGGPPLICKFRFVLEYYSTMGPACRDCPTNRADCFAEKCVTADGVDRGIETVNRNMPGPAIEVCEGDTVVVDVDNRVQGHSTSIHWHGVLQRGSPYFDGVPMLTQCPIPEATTFRYTFETDEIGTYFWHSHDGMQKMDGVTGALIVRSPKDPSLPHYDWDLSEHVVVLQDWMHFFTATKFPGPRVINRGMLPQAILINGRGRFRDPVTNVSNTIPLSEFRVKAGLRYRFRLIHAGCLVCPLQLTIQNHQMTLIATDGFPLRPINIDTIILLPGERFDIVVNANRPTAAYWIHVKAVGECNGLNIYQEAILRYEGSQENQFFTASAGPVGFPTGMIGNALNSACGPGQQGICISQMQAQVPPSQPETQLLTTSRVKRIVLDFDFHQFTYDQLFNNKQYYKFFIPPPADVWLTGRMDNISFVVPPSPPLSQPNVVDEMCASGSPRCCANPPPDTTHRECFNVHSVDLNENVEIIFVDNFATGGIITHPIHLHGYMFYVLEMGTREQRRLGGLERAASGRALLDNPNPAKKDTIAVPSGGYTRVRFVAKNPGYWLIHCHILLHLESGMASVLRVGRQSDLPPVPPGFPTCGNYKPSYH